MNITDPNIGGWGIYRSFPIKYFDYSDNWLLQKSYSLNQYPLTVSVFNRYPTMVKKVPKFFAQTHYARGMKLSGYGGIDGLLLGNLAEKMNFRVKTIEPLGVEKYGFKRGSKFSGALGDVLEGRAEMAFNSRFVIIYGAYNMNTMIPILGDKICVIIPAANKSPQWKAIFRVYDAYFWFALICVTSISGGIYSVLIFYQEKQKRRELHDTFLYKDFKNFVIEEEITVMTKPFWTTVYTMIGVVTNLPIENMGRILIGSCLLAHIIIGGSFGVWFLFHLNDFSPCILHTNLSQFSILKCF